MASDAELEIERLKIGIEEKRLAAELTKATIAKHKDWVATITHEYTAGQTAKAFRIILEEIRSH